MTAAELDVVCKCLETYPAGVGTSSWGYGPLEGMRECELSRVELKVLTYLAHHTAV